MTAVPAGRAERTYPGAAAMLFLLVAAAFLLYAPSLRGTWTYDDFPAIAAKGALDDTAGTAVRALTGRRTLTDFTFALNRAAAGIAPASYHAVNIALHGLCAFLLFLLARRCARRARPSGSGRSFLPLAASLLFLVHPLLSQAVAYAAQRYTSLATLFYLGALETYLAARERRSIPLGIGAFALAFLSMRCKEIAFTLPVILVLCEFFFFPPGKRNWRAGAPFLLLLPLIPASLLFGGEGTGRNITAETLGAFRETADIGRGAYFATQLTVLPRYLGLFLFPKGLTIDHDVAALSGVAESAVLAGGALLALLTWAAWKGRRRFPLVTAGWAWFLVTSAVESSFIPIRDVMVEHRMYLPSVGLFIAASSLLARLPRRGVLLAVMVVPLAFVTHRRATVWSDAIALWEDAAKKAPGAARPWVNLGRAERAAGRFDEAVEHYRRALRLDGALVEAMVGLGLSYERSGKSDDALTWYRKARSAAVDYGPAYDLEAALLGKLSRRREGIALIREGIRLAGETPGRFALLGDLLAGEGAFGEAEETYRRALALDAGREGALIGLVRCLVEEGRTDEAEAILRPLLDAGASAHLWNAAGLVRSSRGDHDGAIDAFHRALAIDPSLRQATANLVRERRSFSRDARGDTLGERDGSRRTDERQGATGDER